MSAIARLLELLLMALRSGRSYDTRVYTMLFAPTLLGMVLDWPLRTKLVNLGCGVVLALVYSVAHWWDKKYLRR